MELGLLGCICNRLERRYLEPPMARNPSWLPDAQCARRAAAGSVLSQIDMSFGDTPLLLNRRRRVFFTPVGETASCRGIALPNLRPVRSTVFLPGARWRFTAHRGLAPLESPCVRLYRERGGRPSASHGWVAFLCGAEMVMGPHCIFPGTSCSTEESYQGRMWGGTHTPARTLARGIAASWAPGPAPRPNSLLTGMAPVNT